jgi:hypothetical protein
MTESFLANFVAETQQEVTNALEDLVKTQKIKERVLAHAEQFARVAATHILNEDEQGLEPIPAVDISGDRELQFLLVLEFLQSAGFKFAPSVMMFESQHPQPPLDRQALGRRLSLRTYDRTPYLVQLIEAAEGAGLGAIE